MRETTTTAAPHRDRSGLPNRRSYIRLKLAADYAQLYAKDQAIAKVQAQNEAAMMLLVFVGVLALVAFIVKPS